MLPAAASLGLAISAIIARFTRSSMLEVLGQDFVRTARAKGVADRAVVYKHALRNALIPVVAMAGTQFVYLIGGAVIIEEVFALPGMGRLVVNAIYQRDYTMIQGAVLLLTSAAVLVNLALDLALSPDRPPDPVHVSGEAGGAAGPRRVPRALRSGSFLVGGLIVAGLLVAALAAPWLAPYAPTTIFPGAEIRPPDLALLARHGRGGPRHPEPRPLRQPRVARGRDPVGGAGGAGRDDPGGGPRLLGRRAGPARHAGLRRALRLPPDPPGHRPGRGPRPEHGQSRPHHRGADAPAVRDARPERDPRAQAAGLRPGRPRARGLPRAHPRRPRAAQHHAHPRGPDEPEPLDRHPGGGGAELPRARHPAARAELGQHAEPRAPVHDHRPVAGAGSGAGHHARGARLQPARGRPARSPGSAPGERAEGGTHETIRADRGRPGAAGVGALRGHVERAATWPTRSTCSRRRPGAAPRASASPSCTRAWARPRSARRRGAWASSWWPA